MKLVMTVDAVGGIWRYAVDLGAELATRGHQVVFAGLGPPPSDGQIAEAPGQVVWGTAPLDWMTDGPAALTAVGPWLARVAEEQRADVLQMNLPSQGAGLRTRVPVVAVCHSCLATWFRAVEGTAPPPAFAWHADLMRQGLARADAVVAPTAAHAAAVRDAYGGDLPVAVPNTSRVTQAPPGGGHGAVAAGRWWDRGKNGAVLEAAAASTDWPVTLVGATEGPDGQRLPVSRAQATGALPHGAAMQRVAAAGIFVSPSLYEPFGLAALEAARLGRPLVLADIPTYRELWHGVARFFPPRDPSALAAEVNALAGDPDARHRLGAKAQARAATYTPARQAEAMLTLYRRLAALQAAE